MGYQLTQEGINAVLGDLSKDYRLFAPKRLTNKGAFSDTDAIRYGEIGRVEEIEFAQKSSQSFKEVLLPISETLFFFTEDSVKEADVQEKKAIVFLRSCDLHAVKRLDDVYLKNGAEDYYYKRLREKVHFILMGCAEAFENCFCVDMQTNGAENYDASLDLRDNHYFVDCKCTQWTDLFLEHARNTCDVIPDRVSGTAVKVKIPDHLDASVAKAELWKSYDNRCIACGRCNFSCPTCTCNTMQDIFYTDNGKVGERRRVWASCMVDGFTDVAGGGQYRQKYGERMRFKVLHKVLDYKQRFGYHMCVGCGRCDDVCPEYISFSEAVNRLTLAQEEVDSK